MKSSLSHLPQTKQQEILAIAEVIKSVIQPEKIILFGSYAKGTQVEDKFPQYFTAVYYSPSIPLNPNFSSSSLLYLSDNR